MYNTVIWQLRTLWNAHHDRCSFHLSPRKDITILLTAFTMLYFSSLDLFILQLGVCTSLSSLPIWLISHDPWQPPVCSLCFFMSLFLTNSISCKDSLFVHFCFCFLDSTYNWNRMVVVCLTSFSILPSKTTHVGTNGKVSVILY